jgi:DNA-binding transcriptional regulator PaaX
MSKGAGATQKKILLLLLGGIALGLSGSPRRYFQIVKTLHSEWKDIDRRVLKRSIQSLYRSRLIDGQPGKDGKWTLVLTEQGKRVALMYNIEEMTIPTPQKWDKKWRIVISDIPERIKKVREAFRMHLKSMGFFELQKSVFVYPFDCKKELEYIIEFYNIRKHVRFIVAHSIDNELHIKQYFKLDKG